MWNGFKDSRAFTLIEVTIVIAIGALIILVVLQAVSNAQQSQRDSTRRQEATQIASALETYAANHGGNYPDDAQTSVIDTDYTSDSISSRWEEVADCSAEIDANTYEVTYEPLGPAGAERDYELFVCLEQGNEAVEVRADN